jgi:chromosome partitioning protein
MTMDTTARQDNLHKIAILNPKGGCGKTTLATNLASYFATRGPPPTLIDCDPGGFSMRWLDMRPADRPRVHGFPDHDHYAQTDVPRRAWPGSKELIVDLPAAMNAHQLFNEIYDADSVLIPIVPSKIDIHSAAQFVTDLLLGAQYDRRTRKLAIVANRTRQNTKSLKMLMRFVTSLGIPVVTQLRDSQNYVHAAASGIGICEMPAYRSGKDLEQFKALIDWLDNWRTRRFVSFVAGPHRPVAEQIVTNAEIIATNTIKN